MLIYSDGEAMQYDNWKKIRATKRTQPCTSCNRSFLKGEVVHQQKSSSFNDSYGAFSCKFNFCPKCIYKESHRDLRAEHRRRQAQEGNCKMAVIVDDCWSNGTPTGGRGQEACFRCNLYCTFGDIYTF